MYNSWNIFHNDIEKINLILLDMQNTSLQSQIHE